MSSPKIPYDIKGFRLALIRLRILERARFEERVQGHAKKVLEARFKAYMVIYNYLYRRISVCGKVEPHEIRDIQHEIFLYLTKGFFEKAYYILNNGVTYDKFLELQRVLDRSIWAFWFRYWAIHSGNRCVDEDYMEPFYVEKLRDPILDPERIAIIREDRKHLINLLLTAPRYCRIGKQRYERIAKSFLLSLYGQHSFFRHRQIPKLKFYYDYVLYAIRKLIKDYHLCIDDVHNSYYDVQVEPTFSQMLADRLGVENIYLPTKNEMFDKRGETKIEKSYQRYQDYERNHTRFLIPD